MGHYLSSTQSQRREMLDALGIDSMEELYSSVPRELITKNGFELPEGKSELEVDRLMRNMAGKNTQFSAVFRGAGAYSHYIPAIVGTVVSKETFLTAYTPYQAEISQGVLQAIFEYQSMICRLTGMDVSNASVYDGASATAEAVAMCRDKRRSKVIISSAAHPEVIETIKTYCWAAGAPVELAPSNNGATDLAALESMIDDKTACVHIQQPNYFGIIEDCERAGQIAHASGAKFIMGINPIAAAILKTPGECAADIAVGEGQPLGMPLSYGGPYLGFMAANSSMMRKLPGRIVGETVDTDGNRAYVLTLQAREQHIRREKASSNICSNQALCAMTAAVYMAAMGPEGMKNAAIQCMSKAHYLASRLEEIKMPLKYGGQFFHEFVTACPDGLDAKRLIECLGADHGILGGLPIEDNCILWCCTEMNTKEEIDRLINVLAENLAEKGGRG